MKALLASIKKYIDGFEHAPSLFDTTARNRCRLKDGRESKRRKVEKHTTICCRPPTAKSTTTTKRSGTPKIGIWAWWKESCRVYEEMYAILDPSAKEKQ